MTHKRSGNIATLFANALRRYLRHLNIPSTLQETPVYVHKDTNQYANCAVGYSDVLLASLCMFPLCMLACSANSIVNM